MSKFSCCGAVFVIVMSLVTGCVVGPRNVLQTAGYETLICHRGESFDAPENTLPAYRMAVERGFGFECDIYLSRDGRVFTFHDRDLNRTTAGANTNRCADVDWEGTVSKLDVGNWGKWKDSKYKGTRPALLEEVLDLARDGRRIYIEVKTGPEIVPHVKRILAAQAKATPENILFISFNAAACRALKEALPEYKVYFLCANKTAEQVIELVRGCKADGVDIRYDSAVHTAEFVRTVRNAGLEFHIWTVDDPKKTVEAFGRGVQTVTTNCALKQLQLLGLD